jgi:hypothetical protein
MTTIEELPVPKEYQEASLNFRWIWNEYLDKEKEVKDEIILMVKILEDEGYSRTKTIQKIIEDHKDLRGFSRATIYRELPNDMKNNYISGAKQLSNTGNVSNETFEKSQEEDANLVEITTSQYETQDFEEIAEVEPSSSFVVDLPPPEPELQNPKVTAFVGQLPKSVLRLAEKIELPPTKLELIANYSNKSILKDHRQIQEKLVKSIAPLTTDQAKVEISQAIRDLETGAIQKIEGQNSYTRDYDLREKIPKKPDRVKHPVLYFLELMDKIDEVLYVGTGHKITREDNVSSYEPNHIAATQKHRFAMLNEMDGRQINILQDKIEVLRDLLDAFDHEIDEVWKNKK